jgi:TP901 family phage tail tape measure protein
MALEVVGVRLVADDAAQYIAALDKAEKAERALGEGAEKGAKGLNALGQASIGAARQIGTLLTNAAADAGRAILQWGADGVRAASGFEDGMNNFASVVGGSLEGSGETLESFKEQFLELGREMPVSTAEVQQAAIEMAKGGIEPATIAAGGLRQTLQFAGAAGLELADAATIAAKTVAGWSAANATGEEKAILLAHATDLLSRAANASTVEVDELALGLYNAQGAARNSGITLDETVTTLAAVAKGFATSAEAGNSFKNFIARIQPTTAPATEAFRELGLLTREGNSAFYDSKGAFIGMSKASALLQKATKDLTAAEKSRLMTAAFQQDAMGVAAQLAELGAEGYDAMTESLTKQMGVAAQAHLKQQGFNTAVDNLSGSLEALQITVFTKVLPAFTGIVQMVAGGVNAITEYAAATMEGNTALSTIAGTVSTLALPLLYGLTAAVAAHALMTTTVSIPAILAQTAAWVANAAVTALALLPYVAIAAAIAVVTLKIDEFNDKITSATDAVLAQKEFWTESGAALEDYGNQSDAAAEKLKPLADNISAMRDLIHDELEQLGERKAAYEAFGIASGYTSEQLDAELATINQHSAGLMVATQAYNDQNQAIIDQEQAVLRAQAAQLTAEGATEALRASTEELGTTAALTKDELDEYAKKIVDIKEKGGAALQSYASTYATFFAGVESRQAEHAAKIEELEAKKNAAVTEEQKAEIDLQIEQANEGYAEQEQNAAASYVRQQEEQKRHLGQMLIDYTVTQALLGNIDKERAAVLTDELAKAYGIAETNASSTFLNQTRIIDAYAADASTDVQTVITKLHDQEEQAKATQKASDEYAKTYTADAVANFTDRKIEADDYIESLDNIPDLVSSSLVLPNIEDRKEEIDDIDGGLRRIPKEVVIRIRVKDEVPEEYKPGSPTPFEMGIRGIRKALDDLSGSAVSLPGITSELGNIAGAVNSVINKSDAPGDAEDLGGNIIEGLAVGMADNIAEAVREASNAAQAIIDQIEDSFDIDSPSGVTMDMGENVALGLLLGLRDMTPAVLNEVNTIMSAMQIAMADAIEAGNEPLADALEAQLDALANIVDDFAGSVSDALIDAYDGVADFARQLSDNIDDIGGFEGWIQDAAAAQLAAAEATAAGMSDPAEAAAFLAERSKQIMEIAKLQQEANDAGMRQEEQINEQHARDLEKIEKDRLALIADRAEVDRDANQDVAALRIRLASAGSDAERYYIQAEIDARLKQQEADRARIDQQLTLNQQAHDAEMQQYKAELDANRRLAEAERTRINQRIELLKRAHEAELAALAEQQATSGGAQELIDLIQGILDNIEVGSEGSGPIIQALGLLLARLNALPGMASGGTMRAMQPYIVGERGPELVVPGATSYIMANQEMRRAQQPAMGGSVSTSYGSLSIHVDARGSNLSETTIERAVMRGVNAVANSADLRLRMGVA